MLARRRLIVSGFSIALLGGIACPAMANISGFNNGVGYTANGATLNVTDPTPPTFAGNTLTLTQSGAYNLATSAFYNTPQAIGGTGFTTQFTYQQTATSDPSAPGDGVTFTIQNAGLTALGDYGGSLGYQGIANSVGVSLDLNQGYPRKNVSAIGKNGYYDDNAGVSIAPVSLESGHPILVTLTYLTATHTLTETLLDQTTAATFSNTFANVDYAGTIGSSTAYVGFTGGTGQNTNTQVISNFSFTSPVPEPATAAAFLLPALFLRRRR
ncbi:MAG: L-type lectin-domain containing protein [Tepidisphaeraceae bacterium]